ncbi:hypothetical protein QR680_000031 [Steinernema hermaphroditum]|uniref:Uncharacterized protein n=1 Tax=Steinernema hermaphroditum TaxID=289476 RepID=A0AA39GT14_9BILA|nr:hypothetical protein QR680_000031 [Steinernema hermaphroditum]
MEYHAHLKFLELTRLSSEFFIRFLSKTQKWPALGVESSGEAVRGQVPQFLNANRQTCFHLVERLSPLLQEAFIFRLAVMLAVNLSSTKHPQTTVRFWLVGLFHEPVRWHPTSLSIIHHTAMT